MGAQNGLYKNQLNSESLREPIKQYVFGQLPSLGANFISSAGGDKF